MDNDAVLQDFGKDLVGLPVSHVWQGYGSAIFLEFGELRTNTGRDGRPRKPSGEFGLMIEWSWRIEDRSTILCGSWSKEEYWEPAFRQLVGRTVSEISLFGRLPEIALTLSGDLHVASFMTSNGDPAWALFDRRNGQVRTMKSEAGELCVKWKDGVSFVLKPSIYDQIPSLLKTALPEFADAAEYKILEGIADDIPGVLLASVAHFLARLSSDATASGIVARGLAFVDELWASRDGPTTDAIRDEFFEGLETYPDALPIIVRTMSPQLREEYANWVADQ